MAASYQSFTTARPTEADFASLLAQLRAVDATAGIQHQPGTLTYIIKKNTPWLPAQIAAAQTVIDTAPATSPQRTAQTAIDQFPIEYRALVLALVDAINVLRAALPSPLPAVTPAQAISAIRAKAATL